MAARQTIRSGFRGREAGLLRVDVSDMVCAQALAVVARAMGRVAAGQPVEVRYNAEDVRRDLLVWAREQGHAVQAEAAGVVRLARR